MREAIQPIQPASSLCLGGLWYHNRPCALVREVVRRGIGDLTLYSAPPSSFEPDLLIGAGLVRKAYLANMTFEYLGMAPNFRAAVERGEIELVEADEATIVGGLMATVEGLPFHPITSLKGTDHLWASPMVRSYRLEDGTELLGAPAIVPDVVLLHAQEGDEFGNLRHKGAVFADLIMAKAGKLVIASVDELIPHREIENEPRLTTIPGYLVDVVVDLPYGAHPCSSHGHYIHDEAHLQEYLTCAEARRSGQDQEAFDRYLRTYVYEPEDHFAYLERVGGLRQLHPLSKAAQEDYGQ
ncbi:MAG: CoA transferase subunit A [Chloroflexi bacterium]|nr:CoA transferase subunit A [Chloroflexota bacterium]